MALWLVRGGRHGEHEERFFSTDRICLTWDNIGGTNLEKAKDYDELRAMAAKLMPDRSPSRLAFAVGQWWPMFQGMKSGDLVVTPRKHKAMIAIAEVIGPAEYDPKAPMPYWHSRKVKWLVKDAPRTAFDQDLLYSFGSIMTICEIKRNDAEKRVRAMLKTGFKVSTETPSKLAETPSESDEERTPPNLEEIARDQIAKAIIAKFKGHGMARLVNAVLMAQGYTTYVSPPGPDKGVDILASPGPLGFGHPRICVQVKSTDGPVDMPTLSQLIGTMQNVQAEQGLLVSWGGFKSSVDRERAQQFFRVRLWDQDDLIDEIQAHYDKLDPDLRAELPLKQIWTLAAQDEAE
jgi:restriction system protein